MESEPDPGAVEAPQPAPVHADASLIRGDTLAARIDNLHADMLGGTALGHHTALWNLVHAFKERVKALVAELEHAAP
ncbi:hypothetical protein [Methylobacterium sp. 1973]|uniref:hypothetical protein n=1 Tax=Methylobacterium sp. 1973 TaxID=3156421 RepID=UPI003393256E